MEYMSRILPTIEIRCEVSKLQKITKRSNFFPGKTLPMWMGLEVKDLKINKAQRNKYK